MADLDKSTDDGLGVKPSVVEVSAAERVINAILTGMNRVLEASIDATKAFFREGKDSPYANIIVTKTSRVNDPAIQALVKALRSEDVRKFINEKYKGAVIPAF